MPLYLQVKDALLHKMSAGHFRPGDRLGTEGELMRSHGVSRITIRKALDLLQQDGIIERFAGKGTFMASKSSSAGWTASSIDDVMKLGAETIPEGLEWGEGTAPSAALRLGLSADEKVYALKAVRTHQRTPVYFIEAYVARDLGRGIRRKDLAQATLMSVIEEKLGLPVVRGVEEIFADIADRKLARALHVNAGFPLLILDICLFGVSDRCLLYTRLWYRADMFRRRNALSRGRHTTLAPRFPLKNARDKA